MESQRHTYRRFGYVAPHGNHFAGFLVGDTHSLFGGHGAWKLFWLKFSGKCAKTSTPQRHVRSQLGQTNECGKGGRKENRHGELSIR